MTRRPKPQRRFPAEVLTDEEVQRLLAACDDTWTGRRNRALLTLVYRSGLRIAEALALRPKDLDPDAGAVRVLFAKGGRDRTVGLDDGGFAAVANWLRERARIQPGPTSPLFCSAWGNPLTTSYIRQFLPPLARAAGIAKRVHAHGLRHTHASQLRAEGVDIGIISRQLGHRSLATTIVYLDHIAPKDVVDTVRKRAWSPTSRSPGAARV